MTRDDTKELLFKIASLFPNFKPQNLTYAIDIWAVVLGNYEKEQIEAALAGYVATNTSGFAPSPGQLLEIVRTAQKKPTDSITPQEAWELVYKAICNSNYNAEQEFAKLPELCQKAVGGVESLKEMAAMPTDTVNSVSQSNFIRTYRDMQKRQENYETIPAQVREVIGSTTQKMISG